MRRAKIVATLGPASNSPGTVRALVEAGMDVARLNLSHGVVLKITSSRIAWSARRRLPLGGPSGSWRTFRDQRSG